MGLFQIFRQLVPATHKESSEQEHEPLMPARESSSRQRDHQSVQSQTKPRARSRASEQGDELSKDVRSSVSSESSSSLSGSQSKRDISLNDPYLDPESYASVSDAQEMDVEWELYSSSSSRAYYDDRGVDKASYTYTGRQTDQSRSSEMSHSDINSRLDPSSVQDQVSYPLSPSTFSHLEYQSSERPQSMMNDHFSYQDYEYRARPDSLEQIPLSDDPLLSDRAFNLPETEVVSAVAPPPNDVDSPKSRQISSWSHTTYQGNSSPRVPQTPQTPIFQWSHRPEEDRGSLSLALLPVVVPNLRSLAPLEREAIDHLRGYEPSSERDSDLWGRYERYLSLTPNHMDMWSEFGDFLIEVRGLEVASERIKKALGTVQDDTPLLILLTRMSCRMCDYMIAAHYVNCAVRLQPNNLEVLTLLRDVQRENKLFDSASDTEALIHNIQRGALQDSGGSTSGSDHGQLS